MLVGIVVWGPLCAIGASMCRSRMMPCPVSAKWAKGNGGRTCQRRQFEGRRGRYASTAWHHPNLVPPPTAGEELGSLKAGDRGRRASSPSFCEYVPACKRDANCHHPTALPHFSTAMASFNNLVSCCGAGGSQHQRPAPGRFGDQVGLPLRRRRFPTSPCPYGGWSLRRRHPRPRETSRASKRNDRKARLV